MKPYYEADGCALYHGDCTRVLSHMDAGTAQTCITSPPYWGLRDYGELGQLGLEPSPEAYVANMLAVFREVRRILRADGTLWLNLGDSYAAGGTGGAPSAKSTLSRHGATGRSPYLDAMGANKARGTPPGLKSKDLVGIPWRVAFALQADGWYLRSDIVWHKPNPMPESVTDRPTKAHEYLFLLTKSERYHYDAEAIAEPVAEATLRDRVDTGRFRDARGYPGQPSAGGGRLGSTDTRNRRSVWTVATQPYAGAHFATFPPKLIRPCVLAGSKPGDVVLDPFNGAGTTGVVALGEGRQYVGVDLSAKYLDLSRERIESATEQRTLDLGGAA